jgi:hypothetical protein
VAAGAGLSFTGDHIFTVGSNIGGGGTIGFTSGALTVGGNYQVTGSTMISGAMVNLTNGTLSNLGTTLAVSAGSLNLGTHNASIATINLTGGEILGSGTLTSGTYNWSDGSMRGPGTTNVVTSINFNGTTPLILDQRTLINHGTADWNNTGYLYLTNNAMVLNASGATMTLNSSVSYNIYGTGTLKNDGTLNFSLGKIDVTTFQQSAGAVLNLKIKGLVPGDDFGQISTLTTALDGALNIDFTGYIPILGSRFVLMNYTASPATQFASVQIIDHLPSKHWDWRLIYRATSLNLLSSTSLYLPLVVK